MRWRETTGTGGKTKDAIIYVFILMTGLGTNMYLGIDK
nr:MAG TPA_asm: hypothetical protein [Caudoviricetes sp.]